MSDVNTRQEEKKKKLGSAGDPQEGGEDPSLASYRTEAPKIPADVHTSCSQSSHSLYDLVLSIFHVYSSKIQQVGTTQGRDKYVFYYHSLSRV